MTTDGLMSRARKVFELTGVAEEEIEAATIRHPQSKALLEACFVALYPPPELLGLTPHMYRQHARELLDRVADGQDLRPATRAEVLASMSNASLIAPPGATFCVLMERLFADLVGPLPREKFSAAVGVHFFSLAPEPYVGAADEMLATFRRRCAKRDRSVQP